MCISNYVTRLLSEGNMFIQTEETPNPLTIKFIPQVPVMESGTIMFYDADQAADVSPLASGLFGVDGVDAVFLGQDFISVTAKRDKSWDALKPHVLSAIMDHFVARKPVLYARDEGADVQSVDDQAVDLSKYDEQTRPLVEQIIELVETRVRPAVADDGGDIIFRDFDGGVVFLELYGACSGCPSSSATLKDGIENMLRHYVPEVVAVEAVNAM